MSGDFTGTDSGKIDKLVAAMVEIKAALRFCLMIVGFGFGIGFPLMVGLLTFLVTQSFSTSAKVDRLADRIGVVRDDHTRITDRLDRLERAGERQ